MILRATRISTRGESGESAESGDSRHEAVYGLRFTSRCLCANHRPDWRCVMYQVLNFLLPCYPGHFRLFPLPGPGQAEAKHLQDH
jgi:hypothetical protein